MLFDAAGAKRALAVLPEVPGAYRVRVLDNSGRPTPLRRLNADDPDGILHIGKTGNLKYRAEQFQQGALTGNASQSGYYFWRYRYALAFPLGCLCVDYVVTASEQDARNLEKQLHEDYWFRFLDLPPLDGQV
jgi:hypothetical protein